MQKYFLYNFLSLIILIVLNVKNLYAESAYRILIIGDSLSAGYGLNPGEDIPNQLLLSLKKQLPNLNLEITNAGVSGDTSKGGLERADWLLSQPYSLVVIELGANDALRGLSPKVSEENLFNLVRKIKAKGIKQILLMGMISPPNMGKPYADEFNPIYKKISKQEQIPLYPFFLKGVAGELKLNQKDGIHPNPQGVGVIVANITPCIKALIQENSNPKTCPIH